MIKNIFKYPLPVIIVLAVMLRLPLLNGSFWMDEAAQALEVIRPFSQQLDIIADFQPPLLHFLLHFAQYISISEWYLRTVGALIPGIISIIFTYKLAERLFSKQVASMSSLLLATSSFHIYFSQELRPYALPGMCASISMYYFYLLLENKNKSYVLKNIFGNLFSKKNSKKSQSKIKPSDWIHLTAANMAGLYSSYLYPFFMIAQFVYLGLQLKNKNFKKVFTSLLTSIVGFLPIVPLFLKQLSAGGSVREHLPGWDQVVSIPQLKALPMVFLKLIYGIVPIDPTPFVAISLFILALSSMSLLFILKKKQLKQLQLIIIWIIVPVLTAWLISFIIPVVRPKRLLFILPALYIFITQVTHTQLYNFLQKKKQLFSPALSVKAVAPAVVFITLFIINLVTTVSYYTNSKLQREDWRSLQSTLHERFSVTDSILVYSFSNEFAPMRWYEQFEPERFTVYKTNTLYIEDVSDLDNQLKVVTAYKTVIVFDYLRDLTDPNRKIEITLQNLGYKEVSVLDYPNIGFVRIFMQPNQVIGMK